VSITRPEHPVRVAIVAVLVLAAANIALWGGLAQVNGPANVQRPTEIVDLVPAEGQSILPQDAVGAVLRTDWSGQLAVDGVVIPDDQLEGDYENLRQLFFDPGPGREFTEWRPGAHRAEVQFWPREIATVEEARRQGRFRSYPWSFDVA